MSSLTTAPVRPFQRVLEALATRMGWDPGRLQENQSAALAVYLNTAIDTVWNFFDWPEIMGSGLLPVAAGIIPWQATPATTRVTTTEAGTNGYFEDALTGWTPVGDWTWADGAVLEVTPAPETNTLAQTLTGLTEGGIYRLTVVLDRLTSPVTLGIEVEADPDYLVEDSLTTAGTYTWDFTANGTTANLLLTASPTVENGPLSLRVAQCSVHGTALVKTAPRPPIDAVRGVYTTDPLATDPCERRPLPFRLGPGCLHLATATGRSAAEAWVYYRPQCPQYTTARYHASTTYQAGSLLDRAFDPATGHVYRALSVLPFSGQPVTNAAYWEKLGVPERLAEAAIQLSRAEALEEQDQYSKAALARSRGMDLLENAALTHLRQSGQTRNYRVPAAPQPLAAA